jgi:hypothetical protein
LARTDSEPSPSKSRALLAILECHVSTGKLIFLSHFCSTRRPTANQWPNLELCLHYCTHPGFVSQVCMLTAMLRTGQRQNRKQLQWAPALLTPGPITVAHLTWRWDDSLLLSDYNRTRFLDRRFDTHKSHFTIL